MRTLVSSFVLCLLFLEVSFAQTFVYVVNQGSDNVSVINVDTNMVVGPLISVGDGPRSISINLDGTRAYVTNVLSDNISVIDVTTDTVVGSPIPVGDAPFEVAITPDGTRGYVTNVLDNNVMVIDTSTNSVVGFAIPVGVNPRGIAISPDGTRAYVVNTQSDNVMIIDTSTNTVVGTPITVGDEPLRIAINPAGTRAYVTNQFSDNVTVINTLTNTPVATIGVGDTPTGLAVTPDGTRVYVSNLVGDTVSVIDTSSNTVIATIPMGDGPVDIAITPDGTRAYVPHTASDDLRIIDTSTNTVVGSPIPTLGTGSRGLYISIIEKVPGDINLDPRRSERFVLTDNTVTAILQDNVGPLEGILIDFEVLTGPNMGESSSPGECSPNSNCTTDANGEVSWTYTGGPVLGTDLIRASFFDEATNQTEFSRPVTTTWVSPISLSPTNATNELLTDHTVTALIETDGGPLSGVFVDFQILGGPNAGKSSAPDSGECTPNDDCTTDGNGQVSWTYNGGIKEGTDTINASFFDQGEVAIDSNLAFKTWVLPQRNIPTISEWGLIATAGILGLASLLVIRRRKQSA